MHYQGTFLLFVFDTNMALQSYISGLLSGVRIWSYIKVVEFHFYVALTEFVRYVVLALVCLLDT